MNKNLQRTLPLLLAVGVNYMAQIPYYLHQYYIGRHLLPSLSGTAMLLLTFSWFVAGYVLFIRRKRYGRAVLLSFLAAQVVFYGHAIALGFINRGGIVAQFNTHSRFLFVIFLIGYINFAAAAYYLVRLSKWHGSGANSV